MQEIEIEFKNLLSESQYKQMRDDYFKNEMPKKQINYYFETELFSFKKHLMALRIREKGSQYIATLKQPSHEGLLETHDLLTKDEADKWFNNQVELKDHIREQIKHLNIHDKDIKYMGSLITYRLEKNVNDMTLVLDYSQYNGQEDYELEIEAPSQVRGEAFFKDVLTKYSIKRTKPENKIQRFFNSLS
ncbi:CYTH domain-containing protein [Piscibacillus sp. B03]|uniref:CYTH domain-containing protein n=1 Tax=Piscibacillus sp. B03 TaxID=3457430 RepID=UPI003FCCBD68